MKEILAILSIPCLIGCSAMMPELFKAIDDIATDGVIQIQIDREAFGKDTNLEVAVSVQNKDQPVTKLP